MPTDLEILNSVEPIFVLESDLFGDTRPNPIHFITYDISNILKPDEFDPNIRGDTSLEADRDR